MMLNLCGRLKYLDEVNALLAQMDANRVEKSGITHSTVMNACAEAHNWEKAIDILEEIKCQPELESSINWEVVYLTVMTACARARKRDESRALFEDLRRRVPP